MAGFVGGGWDGCVVTVEQLREWRGVTPVAGPSGVAITTRLPTAAEDEFVLDVVADAQTAAAGIRLYAAIG